MTLRAPSTTWPECQSTTESGQARLRASSVRILRELAHCLACMAVGQNAEQALVGAMHVVCVVAFVAFVPFELGAPSDLFAGVRLPSGRSPYEVRVCGLRAGVDAGAIMLRAAYGV